MRYLVRENVFFITLIAIGYLTVNYFILKFLPLSKLSESQFYLFSLVDLYSNYTPIFIFYNTMNLVLIGFVSIKLFNIRLGLVSMLDYMLSPWSYYLAHSNSLYVIFVFHLMSVFVLTFAWLNNKFINIISYAFLLASPFYISLTYVYYFPFILLLIVRRKILDSKHIKQLLAYLSLFLVPLIILTINNTVALKVGLSKQISFVENFSDIDPINVYQGISRNNNLGLLGRVIENKYSYFGRQLLSNFMKCVSPATYFTSQEKLLGFSFNPPVLFGFIIPLFFGFSAIYKKYFNYRFAIFYLTLLILPSILSYHSPEIAKLFLIFPLIILTVTFGFERMILIKNIKTRLLLAISVILVGLQFFLFLSDIYLREFVRLKQLI